MLRVLTNDGYDVVLREGRKTCLPSWPYVLRLVNNVNELMLQ